MNGSLLLARDAGLGVWGQYNLGSGWVTVYSYGSHTGDGPLQVGLWGWPAGNGTTVYFDNLVVEHASIPEPATLSLLALGGLTLIGRRRLG